METSALKALEDYITDLSSQTFETIEIFSIEKEYIFLHNSVAYFKQCISKLEDAYCRDLWMQRINFKIEDKYYDADISAYVLENFYMGFIGFITKSVFETIDYTKKEISINETIGRIKNYANEFFRILSMQPVKDLRQIKKDMICLTLA